MARRVAKCILPKLRVGEEEGASQRRVAYDDCSPSLTTGLLYSRRPSNHLPPSPASCEQAAPTMRRACGLGGVRVRWSKWEKRQYIRV